MQRTQLRQIVACIIPFGLLLCLCAAGPALAAPPPLPHLDGTPEEHAAWRATEQGKWVRARELAEALLRNKPGSFAGHYALALAMHYGEGDLARAVYHLERAKALYEQRHGTKPTDAAPWRWHELTLRELAATLGEMERPAPELAILDQYDAVYQPKRLAQRVWPLMKLKRYDEARKMARLAIASGLPDQQLIARSDLCAAECEAGDRQAAYDACTAALASYRNQESGGQVEFSNAAEASLMTFRFDQAERHLAESTRRASADAWGNPYQYLSQLLLLEGRIPEAIAALQASQELRARRPAWLDQHGQARLDQAVASLLLVVGQTERAVQIAQRATARPDRQGVHSGTEQQAGVAGDILLAVTQRELAVRREEEAVTAANLWRALTLRARAVELRYGAWQAERRAAVQLADPTFFVRTLRPYYVGGADLPEWLVPEAVHIAGAGVTLAALAESRRSERARAAASYFDAFEAEAESLRHRWDHALALAERALHTLPQAEVLFQGRIAALAAEAARRLGAPDRAVGHFVTALAKDPAVLRRLSLALPVIIETDGSQVAHAAQALIARSPRFDVTSGPAHRVSLRSVAGGASACLLGPHHEVVACAQTPLGPIAETARRLVADLQAAAFAYKADLSQADLTSLDGSPTATRAERQVKSLLDALGNSPP